MSATATDYPERLSLAEQVARIERSNAETQKFVAEQRKLMAEQSKLMAETANLRFSRFLTPTAAVVGALAGLIAAAPVFVHWLRSVAAGGGGG